MNTTVGYVSSYKSLEVDIIENQKDSWIWKGLWEETNFNQTKLPNDDFSIIVLDVESGNVNVGAKTRRFDFELKRFREIEVSFSNLLKQMKVHQKLSKLLLPEIDHTELT